MRFETEDIQFSPIKVIQAEAGRRGAVSLARDLDKRPEMGRIATRTADFAVLTSEDPRSEDPKKIIDEIARGCFAKGAVEGKNFVRVPERKAAIRFGLEQARKGDFILILGKGHEKTMAIGGVECPWSDHQMVKGELTKIYNV